MQCGRAVFALLKTRMSKEDVVCRVAAAPYPANKSYTVTTGTRSAKEHINS